MMFRCVNRVLSVLVDLFLSFACLADSTRRPPWLTHCPSTRWIRYLLPSAVFHSAVLLHHVVAPPENVLLSKHYVHCLLMGLARPAVVGQDEGAYEKLRGMYNALDIKGEAVPPPEEMDIAKLCKQPFCR